MKILFASMPMDGHFNPLTGLAVYLRQKGHDVRWYTGPTYTPELARLGVPHYPFLTATDVNGENLTDYYPEYKQLGVGPKAIAFAAEKLFFANIEAHLDDIRALRSEFPFEAIVFDSAFYAGLLVGETMAVPAYPIWPAPTPAPVSREAPPPFFGLKPMRGPFGRLRDKVVTAMVESTTKGGMRIWNILRAKEGLAPYRGRPFDLHIDSSTKMFMVGAPGLDFPRSDWPKKLEFVGALLSYGQPGAALPSSVAERLTTYAGRVVLVSQGTIDNRDPDKLFVPSLEALAGSDKLVVVTTGGRHTAELRKRFPQDNVVIEDFIAFDVLMPHVALFISNGGYGSVMRALANGVPLLVAGKLEAKNDVNARLAYRSLAVDLETERPSSKQIAKGVARVLGDPRFRENAARVREELARYDPFAIIERAVVGTGVVAADAPRSRVQERRVS